MTTNPMEIGEAAGARKGIEESQALTLREIVAPPTAPVRMPMRVMASWVAER